MAKMAVEIDVKFVRIVVPVKYDTEDMPQDFPYRKGDMWDVIVDFETGVIEQWPGVAHDLHMKVTDGGSYYLLGKDREVIAKLEEEYVPHGVVPGSYGDYIEMSIAADGTIKEWPKRPNVSRFFNED
jgi:hypothetical protein